MSQKMNNNRRDFIKAASATALSMALPDVASARKPGVKRHIVTLSFDDGFKESSIKTAEIYEKHKLSACINVIASAHMKDFKPPNAYHRSPAGDFGLWNDLKARGHEIMPHSYMHDNLKQLPFEEAKGLILRCLDAFSKELKGFEPKQAVYNFAYNASTPDLEKWLATRVRAFRTAGRAINPWPHKGQVKLTCTSFGPKNCEQAIDKEIEKLLARDTGWLIFNTHGIDKEGWGPLRTTYLDRLLERLAGIESVDILPVGKALSKYMEK